MENILAQKPVVELLKHLPIEALEASSNFQKDYQARTSYQNKQMWQYVNAAFPLSTTIDSTFTSTELVCSNQLNKVCSVPMASLVPNLQGQAIDPRYRLAFPMNTKLSGTEVTFKKRRNEFRLFDIDFNKIIIFSQNGL